MPLSVAERRVLHKNIIEYLTKGSRIMFANKLSSWKDFVASFDFQYSDYTHEDLRTEFLETILPKVFTYDLTPIQKRKVEIFATHFHFRRCEEGFHEIPRKTNLATEGIDYVTPDTRAQFPRVACVVYHAETVHETPSVDPFVTAWVSAINSVDYEVANFRVFRGIKLRKRVQRTRERFKETDELPENLNPAIGKKIVGFRTKAEKLSSKLRLVPY